MSEENVDRKPWIVCELVQEQPDDSAAFVERTDAGEFKVQVEADNWIKDNISGSNMLVSMRRGKAFKAVVRTTEVEF